MVLDVSPVRAEHRAVHDDAVIAAMLHDLLRHPLAGFDVRDIPPTTAQDEQMAQSLD